MDKDFLFKLDHARWMAGIPFVISSGFRCEEYNKSKGFSETSSHITGHATDILTKNSNHRYKILNALIMAGFKRIGIHKDFIHIDNDPYKQEELIWLY